MNTAQEVLLLVGSPKGSRSTSARLGQYLLGQLAARGQGTECLYLYAYLNKPEKEAELLAAAAKADLIILAFPLYIDSIPAGTIRAMELYSKYGQERAFSKPQGLVTIVNSGFPEASQNETALAICRQFAHESGLKWLGGLALGAGGSISGQPLEKLGGMVHNVTKALETAAQDLAAGGALSREAVELMARPMMPRWLYIFMGNLGWTRAARKKGILKKMQDRPYQA